MKSYETIQAIYVHTPFCVQKCLYCDFASYACHDTRKMERYTNALCEEIVRGGAVNLPVHEQATVYFGGGTPSVMPPESIAKIVEALKEHGFWRNPDEATIEVNPGTADLEKLIALRKLGFDRISFGVQSLNDEELRRIGRIHSSEEALHAIESAKQAGFKRISADLMYGLPGQSLASLQDTMTRLTATGIEHISVYGLILEDGTPLTKAVEEGKVILPDDDEVGDMYEFVQWFLKEQGFKRYEISNYAKHNQISKHNSVYWQYLPYAAFGAAACGFDGSKRFTATGDVEAYIEGIKNTENIYDAECLTKDELIGEFMFMGLRTEHGANLEAAQERFGVDVTHEFGNEIEHFTQNGMLTSERNGKVLKLTELGMRFANRVFESFVK